jgi:inner membrane protease subunit 1
MAKISTPNSSRKETRAGQKSEDSKAHDNQHHPPHPPSWRSSYKFLVVFTFQAFILGHFITNHFYVLTSPYGASMLPTIYLSHEIVLISRRYSHGHAIRVGDVVCALHPLMPEGSAVIKRVLGMPGDFVCEGGERMVQVPRGHCWLAGDNVGFSRDSRHYGPVPLGLVMGRVVWRVWPGERWGALKNTMEEVDEGDVYSI